MRAIAHAETVLSWQENLMEQEMPPEWMWPFDAELEGWFDEVDRRRQERMGGGDDDAPADYSSMTENDYAAALRG